MLVHNVVQGSPEWIKIRLGVPTASEFDKILTPTGQLSKQSRDYAFRLIAERLLGERQHNLDGISAVQHGKIYEDEAVKCYEMQFDLDVEKVGFCTTDDGEIGASPDRMVGEDGLLEFKCPEAKTHIGYMIDGLDKGYLPQVQGQLFVTGRKWSDWCSYHPSFPLVRVRVERDEEYISKLAAALAEFVKMKNEMLQLVKGF